ncbi:TetR/AcrR family transcriptional regulator [Streptomyces sp. YKOK-I1]
MTGQAHTTSRRPARARREQLALIAAELFARYGFHNVSVNDIAAAAGISGPAMYRHFPGKQALLDHILRTGLEQILAPVTTRLGPGAPPVPSGADPAQRLTQVYEDLAAAMTGRPEIAALWRRERRHLDGPQRGVIAATMGRAAHLVVGELHRVRPDLPTGDAELLTWAAASVLGSISDHRVRLPQPATEQLLAAIAMNVLTTEPRSAAPGEADRQSYAEPGSLNTRHEQLITVAAQLFRDRGYRAVTMEDIGAATGITGPSIYSHFTGKAELLQAIANRIGERLRQTADHARTTDQSPRQTLDLLIGSYVDTVTDYRDFVATYFSEGHNLPKAAAAQLRRFQRAYTEHWADLLTAARPRLPRKEALIRVHASFAVANDIALTRLVLGRPDEAAELRGLMATVLAHNVP